MNNNDSGELKLHFLDYWRVIRVRLPLIILVFLLVVITAAVVTHFMPKQYQSAVTMQVKENDTLMKVFDRQGGMGFDPRFLTTQFEIIQRKEMLYPVIDSLGLEQRWRGEYGTSKEQAYFRLRNMIDVREIRNTELIQIGVMSTDPNEASEIANRIADEYQRKRIEDQQQMVSRSLTQLQDEVAKQRKKVEDLRGEAARIRIEDKIQDLNPDSVQDPRDAANDVLLSVEQQVSTERLRVSSLRAKYDEIAKLTDDQVMRSITTLEIQDPTISQVLPQFQEASSEEARLLQSGLGPNHPTVKSLRAKKQVMEKQLQDQIKSLRTSLSANIQIAEDSLKELEKRLEEAQSSQQGAKSRAAGYYEAKNAYIQAKNVLEAAEMRLTTETMERTMPQNPAIIWERAEPSPPNAPARPRVMLNILLGVVVGLVFGVGLAFFIEYLDTSVKTMEDVETFLQVPVLAVIPKNISLLVNDTDDNPDAEAYRIMRTNIEFNRKSPDANTITIISGGAGEGKSTTLVNLAYTFAKGGYTTLIIDADLRRPSQHKIFGIENESGLSDYLTTEMDLEEVVHLTKVNNLYLMTSGQLPSDAVGVLNSQRMVELIEEVKGRFDIIFFDSPPILGVSDASVLSSAMDLTIVVVQHRRFPRAMLQRVKQAVSNVGGTILGVVLNNVDVRHDQHYEYYTSYYNYYHKAGNNKRKAARKKKEQVVASTPNTPEDTSDDAY
ncbi:MAG: polysaccharide biosynthesis tyrosine autokinase [Verrucomicrobiaceae bacterium]|nr:MAG: polysaccharide biosynthesis tyrosine autokinase [Verrucomicrobiaceae bacterium]